MSSLSERLTEAFNEALLQLEEVHDFSEADDFSSAVRKDGVTVVLAGPAVGNLLLSAVEDVQKSIRKAGVGVYSKSTPEPSECPCPACQAERALVDKLTTEARERLGVEKLTDHPGAMAITAIQQDSPAAAAAVQRAFHSSVRIEDFIACCKQQAAIHCSPVARQALDQKAHSIWECLHQVKQVMEGSLRA